MLGVLMPGYLFVGDLPRECGFTARRATNNRIDIVFKRWSKVQAWLFS